MRNVRRSFADGQVTGLTSLLSMGQLHWVWWALHGHYHRRCVRLLIVGCSVCEQAEYDVIGEESHFAAWCIVHGYNASAMALSVNEMRKNSYKFGANPDYVNLDLVAEQLANGFPMNPKSEEPIWVMTSISSVLISMTGTSKGTWADMFSCG